MEKGRHRGEEAAVEMLAAGSGTEARVVESTKTVCGWRQRRATYGNSAVELDRIVASAIPAVNKTSLLD